MPRALSWATCFELRQSVKGSMCVLPVLGLVAGAFLARAAIWADSSVRVPSGWSYSASTASGVRTAIVGPWSPCSPSSSRSACSSCSRPRARCPRDTCGSGTAIACRRWCPRCSRARSPSRSLLRHVETDLTAGVVVAASLALLLIYLDRSASSGTSSLAEPPFEVHGAVPPPNRHLQAFPEAVAGT
jgi:hypothetical protein